MSDSRPIRLHAKAITAKTVAVRAPVTISAAAQADGKQGPPTFSATAYSGGVLPAYTAKLDKDVVIDLAGLKPTRNVIANLDHEQRQRVGHATNIVNNKQTLQIDGVLSAATQFRDEVANSAENGFEWEVSIETELEKLVSLAAGKTAIVNGKEVTGPLYIARKSTLSGVAFVSQGADDRNTVRIAASKEKKFHNWLEAKGWEPDELSDDQRATLQAAYDREHGRSTPEPERDNSDSLTAMVQAEKREQERLDKIRLIARRAIKQCPSQIDSIEQIARTAEEEVWDTDRFELHLLRAMGPQTGDFRPTTRRRMEPKVIEAALCMASGLPDIEKHYSEQILDAVDQNRLRGVSMQQLLLQAAVENGYHAVPGERISVGSLRGILEYAFPPAMMRNRLEASFSTLSLPGILGNVANKMILQGYMEEDTSWREIATVKNVSNFHTHTHYRMLDNLEYEEVGPSGELKHGTLGQESFTTQAKTYGKMLGISREQIINDDLGAFDDIRERLGRGAAKKFGNVFWAAFINNSSFFTTARTNYIEGSTTNLGTDGVGLQLGVKAYRQMKTPKADGYKRVGVSAGRPTILLVPPELEFIARQHYVSTNVNTGGSSSATSVPSGNIFAGLYRPVVQDRLSDSNFTGYSTTAWYLFGDFLKPMVVSFLNGNQTPTVESTDADFQLLGILLRGYHDFGCGLGEYLSGTKSKGAA